MSLLMVRGWCSPAQRGPRRERAPRYSCIELPPSCSGPSPPFDVRWLGRVVTDVTDGTKEAQGNAVPAITHSPPYWSPRKLGGRKRWSLPPRKTHRRACQGQDLDVYLTTRRATTPLWQPLRHPRPSHPLTLKSAFRESSGGTASRSCRILKSDLARRSFQPSGRAALLQPAAGGRVFEHWEAWRAQASALAAPRTAAAWRAPRRSRRKRAACPSGLVMASSCPTHQKEASRSARRSRNCNFQ